MPLALKTYPTLAEAGSALKDAGARRAMRASTAAC